MPITINECIKSDDPLSEDIFECLVTFKEETELIDFKIAFENSDKEWLEITKDLLAFTNTFGGYLVFGVKNATFEIIGLPQDQLTLLVDVNKFIQKINKNIDPPITRIRSKQFKNDDKDLVVIFIPPSYDRTHLITKDASFIQLSGKTQTVLHIGTTYVRRSAANHMMDSRDIDDILNRRIDYFKHSLLEKITKVVEAPKGSEIFVLSEDRSNPEHTRFIIQDAPDAIPVKGMSFTITPETNEQEIAGWIAMTTRDPFAIPHSAITWRWYRERELINLSNEQRLWVARYSLQAMTPAFYWLTDCDAMNISVMLNEALSDNGNINALGDIASTGAFLGNKFHKTLITRMGKKVTLLSPASRTIPHNGPKALFRADNIKSNSKNLYEELNKIAQSSKELKSCEPTLTDRYRAQALDCHLYAQDNKYVNNNT